MPDRAVGGSVRVGAAALALAIAASCGGGASKGSGASNGGGDVTVTLPSVPDAAAPSCPRGGLVAVEEASGQVAWSHCATGGSGIEVLGADDRIVLAAEHSDRGGSTLLGLDPDTGETKWTASVSPFNESYGRDAFYADGDRLGSGVVVFGLPTGEGGELVGLDAATGEERWRVQAGGRFVTGHGDEVAVLASPGAMFDTPPDAPQPDLDVVAVDRRTGTARWTRNSGIRDVSAPWGPRLGGEMFVITQIEPHAAQTPLHAMRWDTVGVDLETGVERWRRAGGPLLLLAVGSEHGIGMVPLATGDAVEPTGWRLDGFDARRGKSQWGHDVLDVQAIAIASATSPVVAVATGVIARDETTSAAPTASAVAPALTVFDVATGDVRFRVDDAVMPAAVTPTLVVVEASDALVALDATTGATRWRLPFAHPFGVEAAVRGSQLYLSSSRGIGDPTPTAEGTTSPPSGPGVSPPASPGTPPGQSELASFALADGTTASVTERSEGPGFLCVTVGNAVVQPVCTSPMGLSVPATGSTANLIESAPLTWSGGSGIVWFVTLPDGHPRPVVARRPDGSVWPSAESQTTDSVVVIEPSTPASGSVPPPALDFVTGDGSVVARLPGPR